MSDLILWAAGHVEAWRPFAIAALSLLALGCVRYWWEAVGG